MPITLFLKPPYVSYSQMIIGDNVLLYSQVNVKTKLRYNTLDTVLKLLYIETVIFIEQMQLNSFTLYFSQTICEVMLYFQTIGTIGLSLSFVLHVNNGKIREKCNRTCNEIRER